MMTRTSRLLTVSHSIAGAAVLVLITGCNKAESPDAAASNLAAVTQAADNQVAAARRLEQKDLSIDAYEVAVARADGDHKIAIQKCDALEGRDQKACKERADADYEVAKADAKAIKAAQAP